MEQRPKSVTQGRVRAASKLFLALVLWGACAGGQSGTETFGDDPFTTIAATPDGGAPEPCACAADGGAWDGGTRPDCGVIDPETDVSPACAGTEDGGTQ